MSRVGAFVAVCIGGLVMLAIMEVAVRLINPHWREFYPGRFMTTTTVPGHGNLVAGRPRFDGFFSQNNGDFRVRIRLNDLGLRNPVPSAQADGRIWVIGDSMAFGWGVERTETYTSVLGRLSGRAAFNVAAPGGNVCSYQALSARMPAGARPRAVVVGLIVENDINRYACPGGRRVSVAVPEPAAASPTMSLASVKLFLTQNSALYNFLVVSVKTVAIINETLAAIGLIERPHAYRAEFDLTDPEARAASTATELARLRSMFAQQTPFVVLICPARFEVRDDDPFFAKLRKAVAKELAERDIATVDLTPHLKRAGFAGTHLPHDGHWSKQGHEVAGKALAEWVGRAVN